MRKVIATLVPDSLAGRFGLLLIAALLIGNLAAAFLFARAGTAFDQAIRVQRDMGRLVSLVKSVEESNRETGFAILNRSTTGYTRFSIDPEPVGDGQAQQLDDIIREIHDVLPRNAVRVVHGNAASVREGQSEALMIISVRLDYGPRAGEWLNSLVYPLPPSTAWPQKWAFFVPLIASMITVLVVGLRFLHQITQPLKQLTQVARAVGAGNHSLRLPETGPGELREMASAFNTMQDQISQFEADRQQLLASVGHDLRTPITSLRLRAEVLEDSAQRGPMIRALDEMAVMVEDITLFARGSAPTEALETLDLTRLLGQICADRGLAFSPGAPVLAAVRPVAIRRAVSNLIDNALRYAGSAQVAVVQVGGFAEIRVTDDGPGIPAAELSRITAPFIRGDQSRSRETGGYGLGLAIAEGVAEGHGGSLVLENRQPRGLCARILLPAAGATPPKPTS